MSVRCTTEKARSAVYTQGDRRWTWGGRKKSTDYLEYLGGINGTRWGWIWRIRRRQEKAICHLQGKKISSSELGMHSNISTQKESLGFCFLVFVLFRLPWPSLAGCYRLQPDNNNRKHWCLQPNYERVLASRNARKHVLEAAREHPWPCPWYSLWEGSTGAKLPLGSVSDLIAPAAAKAGL